MMRHGDAIDIYQATMISIRAYLSPGVREAAGKASNRL